MPAERRTDETIRGEIASERELLVESLADLRAGVAAKRRLAAVAAAAVGAGVAAAAAVAVVRRFRK
ncbi:MAG TPA: hypothetical protein VMT74_05575 [Gaiellaceae bacterium]|nr:hypothetical protein [Gaiellaceae bacterium]